MLRAFHSKLLLGKHGPYVRTRCLTEAGIQEVQKEVLVLEKGEEHSYFFQVA